ncbi:MAG: TonB-dependent receptor plug domain-containing protein, partial [Porticoccaceae bacterium]
MYIKNFLKATSILSITAGMYLTPTLSIADEMVEEVVTTGSRAKARSVTETPAPVDVISASELSNQGDTDISNLLRNSVPSYSVNDQPISDAATFMRPANLRGLAPDHTLILVNGKRRHRGAVITWNGNGISNGSQGPDTSVIPAIALKGVEVLRDGASSIYGSDAIAGVINFQLEDASEGGKAE